MIWNSQPLPLMSMLVIAAVHLIITSHELSLYYSHNYRLQYYQNVLFLNNFTYYSSLEKGGTSLNYFTFAILNGKVIISLRYFNKTSSNPKNVPIQYRFKYSALSISLRVTCQRNPLKTQGLFSLIFFGRFLFSIFQNDENAFSFPFFVKKILECFQLKILKTCQKPKTRKIGEKKKSGWP